MALVIASCQGTDKDLTTDQDQVQDQDQADGQDQSQLAEQTEKESEIEEVEELEEPEITDDQRLAMAQAERDELDQRIKEEKGSFYVPLPMINTISDLEKEALQVEAKALYVTGNIAGFKFNQEDIDIYSDYIKYTSGQSDQVVTKDQLANVNRLEKILAICDATEVNALVIDVKNDDGLVKWKSDIEFVDLISSDTSAPFKDPDVLMTYLEENDIYTIARIVAFKDPYYAEREVKHTIQLKEGGIYRDRSGIAWVNPFDPHIWNYVVALSKEAALRGFDEIQYDYVRFPDNAKYYNEVTTFPGRDNRDKDEGIEDFLAFANDELAPYHVTISVDVFAQSTRSWDDHPEDIGQTWRKMALLSDAICPMIYPSHYGPGVYGYDVPDQHPYGVVHQAISEAIERNSAQENPAAIRPWIQGFTASWIDGYINYDAQAIQEQILAAVDLGIHEYIIWDPQNTYDPMTFFYQDQAETTLPGGGLDARGRDSQGALNRYLKALKYGRMSQLYLLTPKGERLADYDTFKEGIEASGLIVKDYAVQTLEEIGPDQYEALVDISFINQHTEETLSLGSQVFKIEMEDAIYKVTPPDLASIDPSAYPLGLLPNEMGQIMVLMYHNIREEEATWDRTPDNFRKDLQTLYDGGYRPISLTDYVTGHITTPLGYTPVVITVDDANANNFDYMENGEIDPNSFVGIYMDFHNQYPDFPMEATFFVDGPSAFGPKSEEKAKINHLLDLGFDIGNHTLRHGNMKQMTADEIQEAIGAQKQALEKLIDDPDYEVNALSIPYGVRPGEDYLTPYLMAGEYAGTSYQNKVALDVGWYPAKSPYDPDFDPANVPRIRASEMNVDSVGMYNYLATFEKYPTRRFISDGKVAKTN